MEKGLSRFMALIFVFGILSSILAAIGIIFIPAIITELDSLAHRIPYYVERIEALINKFNTKYQKVELPATITLVLDRTVRRLEEVTLQFIERTTGAIIGLLSRMFSLIMAPILAFYILKDFEFLQKTVWRLVPKNSRRGIKELLGRINLSLFGFFKGQLFVSLIVGVLSTIGLRFLQVKFYLVIGLLAGFFNVIPYFGPFFGAFPAVIIASFISGRLVLWVILLFFLIQQLEGSIISPKIMGDEVGLHPIIIIFSLLAGGELLGIIGMLLAIPVAAIIKEVLKYIIYEVLLSVDNR